MMATPLENSITRNQMTGTKKTVWILLPTTETGGAVKYSMGIANPFRTHTLNQTDPTIQPTTVHFNKVTRPGHSDWV